MATVSLDAQPRTTTGKGAARKTRARGQLPAVVYRGGDAATPITIDPEAFELAFAKSGDRNMLVSLAFDGGDARTCLVREAQRHPVSRTLEHVDFYEVAADQLVTVPVRVRPVGIAAGTKLGGKLQMICRTLDVRCKPADIPEFVDIDVVSLEVGEFLRASKVRPPKGGELVFTTDFNVVTLIGKKTEAEEEAEEAAAAAALAAESEDADTATAEED